MEVPMNTTQSGPHFPVQHRSLSLDIKGNKTDIVINKYEDTFLVIVTQIGCMGTILAAKKDESVFSDPTYNVSVLFGKRDEWQWLSPVIGDFSGSERSFSGNAEGYYCSCDRESPLVMIE
ncbi:hypothetical protein ZEAMMB73_Zm00001d026319 [Zea mays]|uniref:Uncharacterized protein n=1 Tax=Zea mays TaxID=4577 RepID=A0A1D6JEK8_MAIZE|nr:hypothetical protein ZEAMMB73_Zm00001d026319 [Zea mays]AQK46240.1 hypothetical protein ZEAMMB73_Zm00001d026319 [Zea mays]AQK46241.1 hypothetical protein ZEAMMB73_Zm00001d026319 [Zea mays]